MSGPSVRAGSRTVLVVADHPAVMQVLRLFLDHDGYETIAATTADGAARVLREREVRAVLFDLSVVQAEPAARLRAWRAARPGTPFILCTAWDPARLTTLFGDDPPDGFVPKPFTSAQLQAEIRRAARLRSAKSAEISGRQKAQAPAAAHSSWMLGSAR